MNSKKTKKPILHLICGLPGVGKTTLSKKLEKQGVVRFCPDEWIKDIWRDKAEKEGNLFRDQVEQLQWKIGKELLKSGVSIVIEWGTWGKDERLKLRDEARVLGALVKFYYLEAPKDVLLARIKARNKDLGQYEFFMPEDNLDKEMDDYIGKFQVPDKDELGSYDLLG